MALMILAQLRAVNAQRPLGPVVNNTQPIYAANNDYDEAIDGVLVQHLTVAAVQAFFETVLSLSYKCTFMLYEMKESLTHIT